MLIENIVRVTFGIKDHCVVSAHLNNDKLPIELDARKRRKLPCSITIRKISSMRGVGGMPRLGY